MANTLGLDSLVFQFYIGIDHVRLFGFDSLISTIKPLM